MIKKSYKIMIVPRFIRIFCGLGDEKSLLPRNVFSNYIVFILELVLGFMSIANIKGRKPVLYKNGEN